MCSSLLLYVIRNEFQIFFLSSFPLTVNQIFNILITFPHIDTDKQPKETKGIRADIYRFTIVNRILFTTIIMSSIWCVAGFVYVKCEYVFFFHKTIFPLIKLYGTRTSHPSPFSAFPLYSNNFRNLKLHHIYKYILHTIR